MHPANKLSNLKRRVNRARKTFVNTCPASRHLHLIAERLAAGKPYAMLQEEPEHCAGSMLSVLESLWKLRTKAGWPSAKERQGYIRSYNKNAAKIGMKQIEVR